MKIVFDLDGVIRDLHGYLIKKTGMPYPKQWKFTYKGKDIFQLIKDDKYRALLCAPPAEYYPFIKKQKGLEIWTDQPLRWRPYTERWLKKHLEGYKLVYLSGDHKETLLQFREDTYLVEDRPTLYSYDRIILVDRPYNQGVKCKLRVKTPGELKNVARGCDE